MSDSREIARFEKDDPTPEAAAAFFPDPKPVSSVKQIAMTLRTVGYDVSEADLQDND